MAGDFNFVCSDVDLYDGDAMLHTGDRDAGEAKHWTEELEVQTTLRELHQRDRMFFSSKGSSRIDRVYTTHHAADCFSGAMYVTRLPVDRHISDHDNHVHICKQQL